MLTAFGQLAMIKNGDKFHRLTVIGEGELYLDSFGYNRRTRLCVCECGKAITVRDTSLRSGNTKSCGCLKLDWLATGKAKRKHPLLFEIPDTNECVEWQGGKIKGYGSKRDRQAKRTDYVHRQVWVQVNGPIPVGLEVMHRCDNPPCYNPKHLILGTHADNMADRANKLLAGVKLNAEQAREIRSRKSESPKKLAVEFGVSRETVWNIQKGRTWKAA